MANLEKIIKVTQEQYDILASGGKVGDYVGLQDNYVYMIEDTNEYITTAGGTINGPLTIAKTNETPLTLHYDNNAEYFLRLYPDPNDYTNSYEIDVSDNKAGNVSLSLPSKSGTLAITDDIPTALKNPNALTFGTKTYDGSSAQTITLADLGGQAKGNYVTTDTPQTITGTKTFSGKIVNTYLQHGIIDTHPENNGTIISYYTNDLGYLFERGGSCVAKNITQNKTITVPADVFDCSPSYWYLTLTNTSDVVQIIIKASSTYYYNTRGGIGFGAGAWRAKDVKIEVGYSATNTGTAASPDSDIVWITKINVTNQTEGLVSGMITGPHASEGGKSNDDCEWSYMRLTLTNWATIYPRIAQIFSITYNSRGLHNTFLSKNGGYVYGNILPSNNNRYLGNGSENWAAVYARFFYENGTALADKYLGINATAKTATNLVSFAHSYHRPTASGGDGKQWMRILNFVDNDIANGSRWYGKAVDIEFYNNGYGSVGNYTYMGHVSLCIVVQNHGSFVNESVTIKWRDCKPDIWAPDHIKAVKNANSVEIFMLNDIWDTNIIGVIVRNQGLDVAASSTCYTQEEFNTYIDGKSVVTGIIDTNLAIGRLDNYTKKTIAIPDNTSLDTVTESGFYRLNMNPNFPHSQMIVCRGSDTIAQLVFPYDSTRMYVRTGNPFNTSGGLWHDWKQVAFTDHTHTSINTAFVFNNNDMPEGSANLSATTNAHQISFYRNGLSVPYQMDNSNDGGILRCRGNSESNVILELATWDDSGAGETIQFNYYPTNSQATPTYSVTVPKKTGTIVLTTDSSSAGNAEANKVVTRNDAGSIQTEKLAVSSGTTTKATMQYNSTEDCIEFIFA